MNTFSKAFNQQNLPQTFIFLHIMKTGGRTLVNILKRHFTEDIRFHCGQRPGETLDDLNTFSESKKRSLQLIYGHLTFGIHQHVPQKCKYITLLRNPIDRVVSDYYYALHNPKHYSAQLVKEKNLSLIDYLEQGFIGLNNGQTRQISGTISNEYKFGNADPTLLEIAKKNLDKFFELIGTTEQFDEFLILLKNKLSLSHIMYTKSNVNPLRVKQREISDEEINAIKSLNLFDLELYQYAKDKFQYHIDCASPRLQIELSLLRHLNKQFSMTKVERDEIKEKISNARKRLKQINRDCMQMNRLLEKN